MTGGRRPDDPAHKLIATARRSAQQCGLIILAFVFFVLAVVGLSGLT